jgi:hypothetical protein
MLKFIDARHIKIEEGLTPLFESMGNKSFVKRVIDADCEARGPLLRKGIPEFIERNGPGGVNERSKKAASKSC